MGYLSAGIALVATLPAQLLLRHGPLDWPESILAFAILFAVIWVIAVLLGVLYLPAQAEWVVWYDRPRRRTRASRRLGGEAARRCLSAVGGAAVRAR